jgi:RNA polymerase sigma-70 factor (ECF subfamily)
VSSASDLELLEAWRGGDKVAGDALVERHFASVYRFFRRKLDVDTAKDLAQKTFLTGLEAERRIRDDLRFKAFVLGVARNILLQHLRASGRKAEREAAVPDPESTAESPSRVVALRQEQQILLAALQALPVDLQMTIELHYWEDLTTREIAEVLEVPAGTVKWRLSRARELLRERINEAVQEKDLRDSTLGRLDEWARSLADASR